MGYFDLRHFMDALEERGKLTYVHKEVEKDWEISTIARLIFQGMDPSDRVGLIFEKVRNSRFPVATALFHSREAYALALQTEVEKIYDRWRKGIENPIGYTKAKDAPVKENILQEDEINLSDLPVPTWTPGKDPAPYVTSGCVVTQDPETLKHNVGTYRMMVKGKKRLGILIVPAQHIGIHLAKYRSRNMPMPVAVAVGVDPSVSIVAASKLPYGLDELEVSGGVRGEGLPVVKCESSDMMIPATAEFVLEGHIEPDAYEIEGPVGEDYGYMGREELTSYFDVERVTHRNGAIFQGYLSQMPPSEGGLLISEAYGNSIRRKFERSGESIVKDVYLTEASGSWCHLLIRMGPSYPGHARKIGLLASGFSEATVGKAVIVVDEDIDIRDPFSVEWALALRVDPVKDVVIVPGAPVSSVDWGEKGQKEKQSLGTKVIIDATKKKRFPQISLPRKEFFERALSKWESYGLPPVHVPTRLRLLLDERTE